MNKSSPTSIRNSRVLDFKIQGGSKNMRTNILTIFQIFVLYHYLLGTFFMVKVIQTLFNKEPKLYI